MPVRKLTRGEAGEPCGGAEMISGGTPDPLGTGKDESRQEPAAGDFPLDEMVGALLMGASGGGGQGKEQSRSGSAYSPSRLEKAANEVITQLHAAKQELAKELDANLKQLKAVLQETQRIAKDMEAVLKEAKAESGAEEQATGDGGSKGKEKQKQAPWNPPSLKQAGGKQKKSPETPQWDVPDDSDDEDDDPVPTWEPPQDALQGHQQQQH